MVVRKAAEIADTDNVVVVMAHNDNGWWKQVAD